MSAWGSNPVKEVTLSKEQYKDLCEAVLNTGTDRKKAGTLKDEADFLSGAMVVMERLGIGCPAWPLMIMSGRSLLEERK